MKLLTLKQAEFLSKIPARTLRYHAKKGNLVATRSKSNHNSYRVTLDSLKNFTENKPKRGPRPLAESSEK